jgi:hypothetical protein
MPAGSSSSGPVNVVIGSPSCLSLDQNFANSLVNSNTIVSYGVNDNGVTVLLLRSFVPGETRTFNLQYV